MMGITGYNYHPGFRIKLLTRLLHFWDQQYDQEKSGYHVNSDSTFESFNEPKLWRRNASICDKYINPVYILDSLAKLFDAVEGC